MASELASLVTRLEAVTTRLENISSGGGGDAPPSTASVSDYDGFINKEIAEFVAASNGIDCDELKQVAAQVKQLATEQRKFLEMASKSSKPSQKDFPKLLAAQGELIQKIGETKLPKPKYDLYVRTITNAIGAFAWVSISPAPGPYVKEMGDASEFYSNKVLKELKDKEWVSKWKQVFIFLQSYIKEHHRTGVTWNPKGAPAQPSAPCTGPPPPPPPPPAVEPSSSSAPEKTGADVNALLQDLNKGALVTKGLKKVTDDMKTHKNPSLRAAPLPYKAPATKPKPVSAPTSKSAPRKPPVCELQGKKWVVEYQVNSTLEITDTEMKHTIYIYRCENTTIQIKGKINSITLDNCSKTGVVFESAVAGIDFINCKSVQAQVTGSVFNVVIEKTDGCQVYLSKESINCPIISAKSSEMNVSIPLENGEFKEFPIVEQFRSQFDGKQLITEPSENAE